jgi:hypothetical protein
VQLPGHADHREAAFPGQLSKRPLRDPQVARGLAPRAGSRDAARGDGPRIAYPCSGYPCPSSQGFPRPLCLFCARGGGAVTRRGPTCRQEPWLSPAAGRRRPGLDPPRAHLGSGRGWRGPRGLRDETGGDRGPGAESRGWRRVRLPHRLISRSRVSSSVPYRRSHPAARMPWASSHARIPTSGGSVWHSVSWRFGSSHRVCTIMSYSLKVGGSAGVRSVLEGIS